MRPGRYTSIATKKEISSQILQQVVSPAKSERVYLDPDLVEALRTSDSTLRATGIFLVCI